jgi:predicted DNA-binding transcriptional regulator AlpA
MLSVFVAPAGLIVSGVGLWLLSISAVSFTQGLRDLSSWRSFVLGLVLIFAGNYIYKKGKKTKLINKRQVAQRFGVKEHTIDRWLLDGKLPKPRRRFGFRRWDYNELAGLLKRRLKI